MSKISETGHAKNVANFNTIVAFVTELGETYKPTKETIKLPSLQAKAKAADEVIAEVNTTLANFNSAITNREFAFASLSKLGTRLVNALKATDATPQIIESLVSFNRKLQGKRVSALLTEQEQQAQKAMGNSARQVSASQQSFDSRLDTFDKMVKLLETIPQYSPNEVELKTAMLKKLYTDLKAANSTVVNNATLLGSARTKRNLLLYHAETGLPALTQAVKSYTKSVFGATSPAYKQLSSVAVRSNAL